MSFHMQKNTLRLTTQLFFWGGGGRAKRFGELCVPLKKPWLRPCGGFFGRRLADLHEWKCATSTEGNKLKTLAWSLNLR